MSGREGIQINFQANVDDVVEGGQKVEGSLEDLREKLVQVADESVTTYKEMTEEQQKSFRAQHATEAEFQFAARRLTEQELAERKRAYAKYEEIAKDTNKNVQRSAEDTADGVAKAGEKGFKGAATAAKDAGKEISDGLTDLATDTDLTIGSIGESVGGILSGISALIPGVGGFIGAAVGAVATGLTKQWEDSAKEMEARTQSMYEAMLESGQNFLTRDQISKAVNAELADPEKLKAATAEARLLGIAVEDYTIALVTDGPQREAVLKRTTALLAENNRASDEALTGHERRNRLYERMPINDVVKKFNDLATAQDSATWSVQVNRRAQEEVNETFREQGSVIREARQAFDVFPNSKTVKLQVDSSAVDAYLKNPKTLRVDAQVFTRDGKRVY